MAYKLAANNTTNNPLTSPQRQAMQHKTNKPTHKKQRSKATKNKQARTRPHNVIGLSLLVCHHYLHLKAQVLKR
jgi:hypothetical protein